ncbi:MAG: hypothetical protein AAF726_14160 [Planctomycetota bacterium]
MSPLSRHSVLGVALAALAASCAATFEPAEIAPTPQRPRIGKNTQTTAQDSLELEAGIHWDPNDFVDTPVTLKYGVKDDLEFYFQTAVFRLYEFPAPIDNETGIGDLGFGMRHRFDDGGDGGPAWAFELFGKIPTSDDRNGLGTGGIDPRLPGAFSGATDVRLAGSVEQQAGDLELNGYVALNSLGVPAGGTSYQLLLSGHVARPISESDSVFVELVGTFTEGISSQFLTQAGFYRRIAANMTADAAFGVGLDSDSPAFYIMLGLTTNFGYVR